jgi:hypothetical protein
MITEITHEPVPRGSTQGTLFVDSVTATYNPHAKQTDYVVAFQSGPRVSVTKEVYDEVVRALTKLPTAAFRLRLVAE